MVDSPKRVVEYKRNDSMSLVVYDNYTYIYLQRSHITGGSLTKEETMILDKLLRSYGFVNVKSRNESFVLYGTGFGSHTDNDLSSEMKSFIFIMTIRLNEELSEMFSL